MESGKRNDRPQIAEALRVCRLHKALMEAGVDFVACDFPEANRLTVHILAAVAEHETAMISARTMAALAAAKSRGRTLGGLRGSKERMPVIAAEGALRSLQVRRELALSFRDDLLPAIQALRMEGAESLRSIARGLNEAGLTTPRGGRWTAIQVSRVLSR